MLSLRLKFSTWAGCFLILMGGMRLHAVDSPVSFVVDLPFQPNAATPEWLGHPISLATTFATLALPIEPSDPEASLLVTLYFREKESGFLRVSWQGSDNSAQVLSENFYEGIAMNNQRSLLVSPQVMQAGGTLKFQCGDSTLGIQRIKLEWLNNRSGLVSPQVQDVLVTPAMGNTQPAPNLNGQPKPADPAAWHDQLVNVPITDQPQRIEQGMEFSVQLESAPGSARIALKETGLPWGKHLVVWINQQRAGTITPMVPDLLDEGFLSGANASGSYVGWREGSFYVPVSFLKAGVNAVQFSVEDDGAPADEKISDATTEPVQPLAVKDVLLQLDYPPSTDAAVAKPDSTSSTPTNSATSTETPTP